MNYSNGYDLDKVLPILSNRVGWRSQGDTPASGRFYEGFHAVCSADYLKSIQPNKDITDNDFEDYLASLQTDIISRCLNGVFNEPEFLEELMIHDRIVNSQDVPIENGNSFVGFRIEIAKAYDIAVWLKQVQLYFDGAATFNLYLFKEGVHQPLQTISVTSVAGDQTVIDLTNIVLSYAQYKGQVFYIGYYQKDLGTVRALYEQSRYNTTLCFKLRPWNSQALSPTSFNQKYITWTYYPYGLNFQVASFRDFTGKIIKNAYLFDELIGLQMAYYVLEQVLYTTRNNPEERKLSDKITDGTLQLDLQGAAPISDGPQIQGLGKRIQREAQRVRESFYPKPKASSFTYADCD